MPTAPDVLAAAEPHLVQFYETDEFLSGAVADFLLEGAKAGEPMLLVLTPSHRQPFVDRLAAAGVDVVGATARGQLTVLDAAQTLATFMTERGPDAQRFEQHVGGRIAELVARHPRKRLRVFGEMVDILWREGKEAAAVELEELWNKLQQRHAFSLFCAYVIGNFLKAGDQQRVAHVHTHVLEAEVASPGLARRLDAEIVQRRQIEWALRDALSKQQAAEAAARASERRMKDIADAVPVLVSYIDRDHCYRFMNRTYGEWFGVDPQSLVGRHAREVLGETMYEVVRPRLDEAMSGKVVHYETPAHYRHGPMRDVEATYTPHRSETGEVLGVAVMVRDVTETLRLKAASQAAARKSERLLRITGAIAAAVTAEQVYEAMVEQVGEALDASAGALWLLGDDGRARLVRSKGYSDAARAKYSDVALDSTPRLPALDVLRDGELLWFPTVDNLVARYPHLAGATTPGVTQSVACIPLVVQGQTTGALGFSFRSAGGLEDDDRPFLQLVAQYGSQALERLRLLTAEKQAREQAELLFGLAQTVMRATKVDEIFPATLEAIDRTLGAKRSAILVYDEAGVMRFRAWRGLSDGYRKTVEGHSPWARDAKDPQVVWVGDAMNDPSLAAYRELFASERIGALGFIPLVASGQLLGKFMVYYEQRRVLAPHELELASAIANHVAAAAARFQAVDGLHQTVRFNEMFTAILGHDLRNPLGAIMTAAQLLMRRADNEKQLKPLSRIMSSGDRMARMIDQLLDFTRVRMGSGIPLQPRPIDVRPVIEQVIAELDMQYPGAELVFECQGDTAGQWDGDRLGQVFSNLVGNALQHGREAGRVTVRIDGSKPGELRASVHNAGVVNPDRLPTLFEPMRGSDRRGEKALGLGLGLYISREIARAHGGTITVQSSEPVGTRFDVVLPRS